MLGTVGATPSPLLAGQVGCSLPTRQGAPALRGDHRWERVLQGSQLCSNQSKRQLPTLPFQQDVIFSLQTFIWASYCSLYPSEVSCLIW